MNTVNIYLSGVCGNATDEGVEWRKTASERLEKIAEWCGRSVKVVDPTKYFAYNIVKHRTEKQIKEFYLSKMVKCDIVLLNLNNTQCSVSTGQECQFARDHEIPIIGFGSEEVYPWLEADCQVVFEDMSLALNYIRDYYIV